MQLLDYPIRKLLQDAVTGLPNQSESYLPTKLEKSVSNCAVIVISYKLLFQSESLIICQQDITTTLEEDSTSVISS